MKRVILILLSLMMVMSMVACGGQDTTPTTAPDMAEISATAPAPEVVPVENTAPAPGGTDAENGITEAEFLEICEKSFNAIWRNPVNHAEATDYLAAELEWLQFYFDEAGYTLTDDKIGSYIAWRSTTHPNPIPEFEFTSISNNAYVSVWITTVYTHPYLNSEYEVDLLPTLSDLRSGTKLENPAICDEVLWVRFTLDGQEVYVPGEEVTFKSPQSTTTTTPSSPTTTPSTSTSTPSTVTNAEASFTEVNEVVYATSTVNIRSSYSSDSTRLGQLTTAQSVTRIGIGTGAASGWSKVSLSDGTIAYIHSSYLSLTKPTVSSTNNTTNSSSKPQTSTNSSGVEEVGSLDDPSPGSNIITGDASSGYLVDPEDQGVGPSHGIKDPNHCWAGNCTHPEGYHEKSSGIDFAALRPTQRPGSTNSP